MAFYTDYTTVVPYNTSVQITHTDVSNAIADILVAHAGFTLIGYATAGVASSATNYAEIETNSIRVRLYSTSSSLGSGITFALYYVGGTSAIVSSTQNLPFVTTSYVTATIRLFNAPYSIPICILLSNSNYAWACTKLIVESLSTGDILYGLSAAQGISSAQAIADGRYGTVFPTYASSIGFYALESGRQVLIPQLLGTVSGSSNISGGKLYRTKGIYMSQSYLQTGIVQVGTRYFYIQDNYACEIQNA